MKPNGMRAWRKTARRWRRKQNRHWRKTGAPCVADGTGRWYRRQQAFFKQRPAAPSRPFTPRSLVGMTQSARKRAARFYPCAGCVACTDGIESTRPPIEPWRCDLERLDLFDPAMWGRKPDSVPECRQEWLRLWAKQSAKYRIGQSLSPCLGCEECRGYDDGIGVIHCDGSGVIPARSRVNASKALAVEPADDLG